MFTSIILTVKHNIRNFVVVREVVWWLLEGSLVHGPDGASPTPHICLLDVVGVGLLLVELLTPCQTVEHRLRHGNRGLRDGITATTHSVCCVHIVSTWIMVVWWLKRFNISQGVLHIFNYTLQRFIIIDQFYSLWSQQNLILNSEGLINRKKPIYWYITILEFDNL